MSNNSLQFSLYNVVDGEVLEQKCTACELSDNKLLQTNCMSGKGPTPADLLFIGKAPGKEDDGIGDPMTGKNGRLFKELLTEAGINPESVFISNCLKCYAGDRKLKDKHWAACKDHFLRELELVKPKAVISVGAEALAWLTGQKGLRKLRKHGLPCLQNDNVLVFPINQPAQLWHAQGSSKTRLRAEMLEDLVWIRKRLEDGNLHKQDEMELDYKEAETIEDVTEFFNELKQFPELACDLETALKDFSAGCLFPSDISGIASIGFSGRKGHARVFPLYALGITTYYWWEDYELEYVLNVVKKLLTTKKIFGHNFVQFDQKWVHSEWPDIEIGSLDIDFDTMYASYLLDEEETNKLEDLSKIYTSMAPWKKMYDPKDTRKMNYYLCRDVDATFRLKEVFLEMMDDNLKRIQEEVAIPLGNELCRMEWKGVYIDGKNLDDLSTTLGNELEKELLAMRSIDSIQAYEAEENTKLNPASTKQLPLIFEEYLKLPCISRTEGGKYSTGAGVLEAHKNVPFVKSLQRWRGLSKLKGTYCEGVKSRVDKDSVIHTTYSQHTKTGRLASENPNLQNIPREATAGKVISNGKLLKSLFTARPGYGFIQADYSQAKLRVLAAYSLDPALTGIFVRGEDAHTATAAEVYEKSIAEVSGAERNNAKHVNFGVPYGMSEEGIVKTFIEAGNTEDAGRKFLSSHKRTFPLVWSYMKDQADIVQEQMFQETYLGRRKRYETVDKAALRQAYNFPIQSTAGELTLIALIRCGKALRKMGLDAYPLLTVHDSIVFEVELSILWEVAAITKHIMENLNFSWLTVPMVVDMEAGLNWGKLKKMNLETQEFYQDD